MSDKKLNVLIVISNLGFGGAERQVVEIANQLDQNRFTVNVCILSKHAPLASHLVDADTRLHMIPKQNRFDFRVVFRLAHLIRRLEIDLVHGFLFDAELSTRLAATLSHNLVVVGSERNSNHNYKLINILAYKWTQGLMSLCVANSETGKRFNMETFGVRESNYKVVYNGVDTVRFAPRDVSNARKMLKLPQGKTIIGMIASFKRQKNHAYLLRAIKLLALKRSDFHLILVGSTVFEGDRNSSEYFQGVLDEIEALEIGDFVSVIGATNAIETIYNACDFTALPSHYEGTPNVALESLSSGVPVVATDVSDNRIIIPNGRVGFIVPLDNEGLFSERLEKLVSDTSFRTQMSNEARSWALERFSVTRMVEQISVIYESAIRSQRKAR